jgi:hypothetical protein
LHDEFFQSSSRPPNRMAGEPTRPRSACAAILGPCGKPRSKWRVPQSRVGRFE